MLIARACYKVLIKALPRLSLLLGVGALTIATSTAIADEPVTNPMAGEDHWNAVTDTLSLSEQQEKELDKIARDYRDEVARLDETGSDLRQRIHTLDYDALGFGEILGISSEMGRLVSQKTEAMLKAQKALFEILDPSQKIALTELYVDQREQREQFLRAMMAAPESAE